MNTGKQQTTCPSNHKFGKDWSDFDDCDGCPLFNACGKENERLKAKK